MPKKVKGKNPDKMSHLIFLKKYSQQQKQWHKNSLHICWECQTIYSNSYLKLHNIHLLHLFVDMYISIFLKKSMIVQDSPLKNFKKWIQNLFFWVPT